MIKVDIENYLKIFKIPEQSDIDFYPERNEFLCKSPLWKKFAKGMTDSWHGWQECSRSMNDRITALESELAAANKRIADSIGQEALAFINSEDEAISKYEYNDLVKNGYISSNQYIPLYALPPIPEDEVKLDK